MMHDAKQERQTYRGHRMPSVGLGTFRVSEEDAYHSCTCALEAGYTHIDTAQLYENERAVGNAVAQFNKRAGGAADVWVTTKVWQTNFGYNPLIASVQASLKALGMKQVSLLLLHCPPDAPLRAETWRAMEDVLNVGYAKEIGVSNYGIHHLKELLLTCTMPPAVNQVEVHPWCARAELVNFCQSKGIVVTAYSPLAKGRFLRDPTLVNIASEHVKSPAQVLVRYALQRGMVALPKSENRARIAQNGRVWDFELTDDEMARLNALDRGAVTGWDPTTWA
eukprot:TRINITY_DN1889_c0_g1_i2.p1 TRINITY_DN1889_c0_g1~~TRINITY_DN1889_c0_g1_i2.p1  ORF type:complete len:279 (+),score=61.18 TRINITY_DN1889_c0_g1_i2:1888-2724(+)